MAKRGNGEGSIYYRNSDKKWVGSVTLGKGKRKVIYGKTRKEVQEKLKIVMHDQQQGTLVTAQPQTVAHFLTDWLENTHRRRLRPRTYERYREALYLHIIPSLGHVQLQKLTARQVQAFYTRKADEGFAPATIIYYHSVLHNALDTAVKWGLVVRNVCDLVAPPRKERFEIQPLTMEQMQHLLATLRGHKWEALYTLAMATGMRRGELLGLKWQDINFEAGRLQVRRVLSRVPTHMPAREHVYVEAEPKTQKSRRSVMIAPFALEALKKHRVSQLEDKVKAGECWQEHDYVFCTLQGRHLGPNHVVVEFKKLLTRAGLPNIRSSYNRLGPTAIETPGKGGRRHEYMSVEQERSGSRSPFSRERHTEKLPREKKFSERVRAEIKHEVHMTSIYRLLDRHGWRKLVPRPRHPKAKAEEQAAFKKSLRRRFKRDFPHAILMTEDQC